MIPARYLFDITREKNEFGQPHQKCPSSVEEKLCIVSGLQLHKKTLWGRSLHGRKKICWCWQGFFLNFFDNEYFWQMFPSKLANLVKFTL
jgi:hypothetical protein